MSDNIHFIVNPAAGKTRPEIPKLKHLLLRKLKQAKVHETTHSGHATALTADLLKNLATTIVAVGGDGTVNEVVNGFFENGQLINPRASLGIIMLGTGGDFKRTWGWTSSLEENLDRIEANKVLHMDLGAVKATHGTLQKERFFINIASVGVTGQVVEQVQTNGKRLGKATYLASTIQAFLKYKPALMKAHLDELPKSFAKCQLIAFANGQYFGGGMKIAPDASTTDGLLDTIALQNMGLLKFLRSSSKIYGGTHLTLDGVSSCRVKEARVESEVPYPLLIEIDGERFGNLPATFSIVPKAIPLII